ncbi:hypothetical protein AAF712_001323 [Marasmius tenuissimus]|uniref:Uncharacterized protein n=1 Tax=Marasmius tenuissimus TaxID=585030 RepID=A0ABR3ABX7_9AGAR
MDSAHSLEPRNSRPITPSQEGSPTHSNDSQPSLSELSPHHFTFSDQAPSTADSQQSKPSVYKRASLALAQAIRELEEDAEDEVLMPRSMPVPRSTEHSKEMMRSSGQYEAGMAISSDNDAAHIEEATRASPILSRVSPGYVPGMPRPMTPHEDLEHDILRSHSTTPRATHSASPSESSNMVPSSLMSSILSQGSTSLPRHSSRPTSPLASSVFLQRKTSVQNGEKGRSNGDYSFSSDVPAYNWRRPSSPPTGSSPPSGPSSQRPSTPSNVTWTYPSNKPSVQKAVHTRSGSWFSDGGAGSVDTHEIYESSNKTTTRSLRSPALPDSPILSPGHTNMASFSSTYSGLSDNRPSSPMSKLELTAPASPVNRTFRSPTPTQAPSRSPTSPTFSGFEMTSKQGSRRSSKQNSASHFSLTAFNPVVFSPIANSSRSSLESVGSSYHSGDGDKNDRLAAFVDVDSQEPVWHDVSFPSQSHSTSSGGSPDLEGNAEDVISRAGGIDKSDILAIQEKLFGFAYAKAVAVAEPQPRERAPSLRRRRPSTSQSNYSFNGRIASPPPPTQSPPPNATEQLSSKASALLKSVVDSIQDQPNLSLNSSVVIQPESPNQVSDDGDLSPTTRRNRDLAQVLFGDNGDFQESSLLSSTSPGEENYLGFSEHEKTSTVASSSGQDTVSSIASSSSRNADNDAELAREVQRKAEAAMVALKKPYNTASKEGFSSTTSLPRKRITPHQISTPTLVSASTSVDTIPLRPPPISVQQSSKLGSRFKKLRGTLRKNNNNTTPTGAEVTPYPIDIQVSPPGQTIQYDPRKLHPIGGVANSATELGGFNVPSTPIAPVPSPPASAGPGLKGFMARFRGKQRPMDAVAEYDRHETPLRTVPMRSEKPPVGSPTGPSAPASANEANASTYSLPKPVHAPTSEPPPPPPPTSPPPPADTSVEESAALRQLFDAASNLGLDQRKLNDLLLVRNGSVSSKSTDWTMLTRNNSTANARGSSDQSRAEKVVSPARTDTPETPVSRRPSTRLSSDAPRKLRERTVDPTSVVLRRTILFASDGKGGLTPNLNVTTSKSSSRRRRASAASISSRSIHERVPTPPPPPPRTSTSRRMSTDSAPPVPPISPLVASRPDVFLSVPGTANGHENRSAHDSFYEMYADDNRGVSSDGNKRNTTMPDAGQGIEILELANGETIWQIVNGLRDDDAESIYTGRTSFASEYDNDDSVQLYFKEHQRTGSQGSTNSFFSRRKSVKGKGGGQARPETKVFFSSSAQIGRLIDNLSQGMDAGSFNVIPGQTNTGYSATSSLSDADVQYTMEERLERMLGRLERGET